MSLASLRNTDVVQLLSQVIEDLVSGEILQVRAAQPFEIKAYGMIAYMPWAILNPFQSLCKTD